MTTQTRTLFGNRGARAISPFGMNEASFGAMAEWP